MCRNKFDKSNVWLNIKGDISADHLKPAETIAEEVNRAELDVRLNKAAFDLTIRIREILEGHLYRGEKAQIRELDLGVKP